MSRTQEFKNGRSGLTDHDRAVIDFETKNPGYGQGGTKESAIRETLGKTATEYYQHLNRLADSGPAHAYNATTMKRVQRVRDRKEQARGTMAWGM
jgi:hypothetical protein